MTEEPPTVWSALEVLNRQAGIRLLFSDIGLPRGVDGWALAHQAVGRITSLNAVDDGLREQRGGDTAQSPMPGSDLLAKPFTFSELAASIRARPGRPADSAATLMQ